MKNSVSLGFTTLLTSAVLTVGAGALLDKPASEEEGKQTNASELLEPKAGFKILNDAVECSDYDSHECSVPVMLHAVSDGEPPRFAIVLISRGTQVPVESVIPTYAQGTAGRLPAGSLTPVIVKVRTSGPIQDYVPATGYIGIGNGATFEGKPKKLRLGAPSAGRWQSAVVLVTGALALLVTFAAGAMVRSGGGLAARMGSPNWRGADSWSTNITVGASFVNALMTAGLAADQLHYMSRTAYSIVVVLFSSLLVLAPVVFGLFRSRVRGIGAPSPNPLLPDRPIVELFEGYVATFLAAGWLTLWSSLGQLATFGLLIYELRQTNGLSEPVVWLISVLIAAAMAGITGYAGYGMVTTARLAPPKPGDVKPRPACEGGSETRVKLEAISSPQAAADWALL